MTTSSAHLSSDCWFVILPRIRNVFTYCQALLVLLFPFPAREDQLLRSRVQGADQSILFATTMAGCYVLCKSLLVAATLLLLISCATAASSRKLRFDLDGLEDMFGGEANDMSACHQLSD